MEPSKDPHHAPDHDNDNVNNNSESNDIIEPPPLLVERPPTIENEMSQMAIVSEQSTPLIACAENTNQSNDSLGSNTPNNSALNSTVASARPLRHHAFHNRHASTGRITGFGGGATTTNHQNLLRKQASSSNSSTFTPSTASSFHESLAHHPISSNPPRISIKRGLTDPSAIMDDGPADDHDSVSTSHQSLGWSLVETSSDLPASTAPCQRSLHTAAILNNSLYVFGGYDGQSRVNDFHAFSFTERRWSPVLPSATSEPPPSPRDRHIAVVHSNSFYVFGGFDGQSRINDFFGFDFSSMSWRQVTSAVGSGPSPRHSHAGVVYGDAMYVFGGYDGSYRSDFHEYHFLERTWTGVPSSGRPPRARYRATTVVHESTMLLFGGHDGTRHLADTHIFDFQNRVWATLVTEGPPPIPRDSHVAVVHENSMYIFGGSTGEAMNDLHELKLGRPVAKWSSVVRSSSHVTPGHRFCHVAVVYGDAMYVFGGYDGSNRLNDFIKFDFEIDDLTCAVPPSTLLSDLRSFIDNDTMSDVTLLIDNRPVYAHKMMLMRSSYFRAMLTGNMCESQQNTIRLSQVRHPIFLAILEYLYTDTVTIDISEAMELFVAADQFCIPRLKAICEKKMLGSITVENAASIYYAADLHTAKSLKQKTLKFILAHFECVSKTKAFEEMARGNVELVFEILRRR